VTTPPLPAPVSDRHRALCLAARILASNHGEQLLTGVLDELLVLYDAENAMVIHRSPGANPGRRQAVREYRVRAGTGGSGVFITAVAGCSGNIVEVGEAIWLRIRRQVGSTRLPRTA
jgi:hypothetical protein